MKDKYEQYYKLINGESQLPIGVCKKILSYDGIC